MISRHAADWAVFKGIEKRTARVGFVQVPGEGVGLPRVGNVTLLFRIDKTSLGVSRIGVATPRDDCPYTKSNVNTFIRARVYRVSLTSCVGTPYTNSPPSSIVTMRSLYLD